MYTLAGADRPYRVLVEAMRQGAATVHPDGTVTYGNRALADLLGLPPGRLVESRLPDFAAAEDRPAVEALMRAGRAGPASGAAGLARADGTRAAVLLTFNPLPADGGAAVGGLVTDLTPQRHHEALAAAHAALAEERELLRVTLGSIGDAVVTTGPDGRVTSLNAAAEALTGWGREEAVGQPLGAVFRVADEGTGGPIEDSAAPIRLRGGVVGCVRVFRDVSERRRPERANADRLQAARLLAAIIESSADPIVSKSLDGIIQSWNAAAERLSGCRAGEAVGRPISLLIPADRAAEEDRIIARIRAGGRVEHLDTVRVRKDGTPVHVSLTVSPVRDEAGRVVGASKIVRDVSDRVAAGRALWESEDRAAFVRRSSGVGFWYCDLPFDVLQWDELVKAHFHLPPDAPVTIDTSYARIHPDDREPTRRAIERSIADRTGCDTAYRTVHPGTGAVKWVRAIGRTFYAADGTPARFDGVTLDVTAQKRAETALREARGFLHATLDALSGHIAVLDATGIILEVNRSWREFATHNDLAGANVGTGGNYLEVCEETGGGCDDAGRAADGLREVIAGRRDTFTVEYPPQPDRAAVVPDAGDPVRGGRPAPVRRRPRADHGGQSGRGEPPRERGAVPHPGRAGAGVRHLRHRHRRPGDHLERGVRRVLGFEEAEFVGRDIAPAIFTPEDAASGAARRDLAAAGSATDDRWMVRKDGTRFWSAGITTARRDPAGRLVGFTKVMRDMTAQKAMENERRQLAADLSEADRRKDEFLATLAHELRNPLAPIRNGLQILRLAGGPGPALDKPLGMMERQLGQMVRLIDDLLDVSRVSWGKMTLHKTRGPLATVVEQAVETSRPLVEQGGHEMVVERPPEPVFVDADVTRLAQVVSNLSNNAAKYTDRGGRIRLGVGRQGDEAVLRVRDTGVGIPATMLPRVFDRFTQGDRSPEKAQGGLGIGLTLVKRLVEMHGGTVEAHSEGPGRRRTTGSPDRPVPRPGGGRQRGRGRKPVPAPDHKGE